MAKKSAKANKAQIVRDAFGELGINATAKQVQEYGKSKGVNIAAAQVSNIRTKLKSGKGKKKAKSAKHKGPVSFTIDDFKKVRNVVEEVGGLDRAKELLSVLEEVKGL